MKNLLLALVLACTYTTITAQCSLDDIVTQSPFCDQVGDLIVLEDIDFQYANVGSGFDVFINSELIDDNVPYTTVGDYGLEFPCVWAADIFVLTLCDSDDADCCTEIEVDNPCFDVCESQCTITDITVDVTACEQGAFDVLIDFEYSGTGTSFSIVGNGGSYGTYEYDDLPISLLTLAADCNTDYEFIFIDEEVNDCQGEAILGPVCCNDCEIISIDFGPNPLCDGDFIVTDWFIFHENTSESGFDIFVNGDFLTYVQYVGEGPYTFDIPDPETEFFTLMACDNDNPDCCFTSEWENPCFSSSDCIFTALEQEGDLECIDGFLLLGDFYIYGDGLGNSGFHVTVNDEVLWTINYENDDVYEFEIDVVPPSDEYFTILICDAENVDCCIVEEFLNPCYDGSAPTCEIYDLAVEVISCEGDVFDIEVSFEYQETGSEFELRGNGNSYGIFSYEELPITITNLIADCETDYEFIVIDQTDMDCSADIGIGTICCDQDECVISNMELEITECLEGTFTVGITFDYINVTNDFFDWLIPGVGSGTEEYTNLPLFVEITNGEMALFSLHINDNDNPNCSLTGEFENPCFDDEPLECAITDIEATVTGCELGVFDVVVTCEYEGVGDTFELRGNGNSYGMYAYEELPITLEGLIADCETDYEFVIRDQEDTDCHNDTGIGTVCCDDDPCELNALEIELGECDGGAFTIIIDFDHTNAGQTFEYEIPGEISGTNSYSNLPLEFTLTNIEDEFLEIIISDSADPDCQIIGQFLNPCYEENLFSGGGTMSLVGDDDMYWLTYTLLEGQLQCDYKISIDGEYHSTAEMGDESIEIGPFDCNAEDEVEVILENVCSGTFIYFTVNLQDYDCSLVAVDDLANVEVTWDIFNSRLNIGGVPEKGLNVNLYDTKGSVYYTRVLDSKVEHELVFSGLPFGIYFVELTSPDNGARAIKKIVVIP